MDDPMKKTLVSVSLLALLSAAAVFLGAGPLASWAKEESSDVAAKCLKNAQKGGLELRSVGRLGFGPGGLLLMSDPKSASVLAIDTGDTGPVEKLQGRIDDIDARLASGVGAPAGGVTIVDMAVNPASGKIYFSLTRTADNAPLLVRVSAAGKVEGVDLDSMKYVRLTLPAGENARLQNVSDLALVDDRVVVAGQSSDEFSNKIYVFPVPLEHGVSANYYSAETYHVSHRKWETKAPIQSFVPYEEDGNHYIVGAFACTPIAKFPLGGFTDGAKIQGVSVLELGSGNRPRDMFMYEKGGEQWLVANTKRFKENKFGPSFYWGARVDMEYLAADAPDETNENAPRRNVKAPSGPEAEGIEVVEELYGAVLVSQLENDEVIVLRETGEENKHVLELARMP